MSQELERRSTIVGADSYFERINEMYALSRLMKGRSIAYYEMLQGLSHKVRAVFSEIYSDLQKNADILRFISADDRQELVELISGLGSINSIVNMDIGQGNACISLLELSDYETRGKSSASSWELERAVEVMLNGADISALSRDPMDIIRDWGEDYAADGNEERRSYIYNVSQGQGRDFLSDVLQRHRYESNGRELIGHCGRAIGSSNYLEYIEQCVLDSDIISNCRDREYGQFIADMLMRWLKPLKAI